MSLPRARTLVHGVGGHAERAGARARFAARRAGRWGLGLAKVALWLVVVTSSLMLIVVLAARGATTSREAALQRERAAWARDAVTHRAIQIDRVSKQAP